MMALNRKLIIADRQVHANNFSVGKLVGFDLHGKTVGIIGTGRIGSVCARILHGFGCSLLGYDVVKNHELEARCSLQYVDLKSLCEKADIITLHTCLTPETKYLINLNLIRTMKHGVMLINTARGAVVNTADVIQGLQDGQIGYYGADVYEGEKGIFFYDRTDNAPEDPVLRQLLGMPNVLITPHQAYATHEALRNIADTTCENIRNWGLGKSAAHEL
jgi:D-lactate dehydrogenase